MYAACTTAASRASEALACVAGGLCAPFCVFVFSCVARMALSFFRMYDDHRNRSTMIVVQ
jgi:hypothetical protein